MAISLSGNGLLFPLTPAELIRRAESHPKLAALRKLCQTTWPVTSQVVRIPLWWRLPGRRSKHAQDMQGGPPSGRVRRLRAQRGELWPYRVERPFDWEWGIGETG